MSLYKKLMMHLKEHCSYVTLGIHAVEGLTFTGSSAIDHLCLRVHLPPPCFRELHVGWPTASDRVELNMYTLYSIMKKATAYRHERVRFRVAWQPQGYYAVTVTFETVNKSERFHMRGARPTAALQLPPPPPTPLTASHTPTVTLNPTLLADAFRRFDEESFRTVTLSVHHQCHRHPHTVAFAPVHDTLRLRGHADSIRGAVYIPYWSAEERDDDGERERRTETDAPSAPPLPTTKRRLGDFLLASLRSVTRFASLAQPKQLALQTVELGHPSTHSPLCVAFTVADRGTVTCYLPPMAPESTLWCYGREGDAVSSSSSEEDERILARVQPPRRRAFASASARDSGVDDAPE